MTDDTHPEETDPGVLDWFCGPETDPPCTPHTLAGRRRAIVVLGELWGFPDGAKVAVGPAGPGLLSEIVPVPPDGLPPVESGELAPLHPEAMARVQAGLRRWQEAVGPATSWMDRYQEGTAEPHEHTKYGVPGLGLRRRTWRHIHPLPAGPQFPGGAHDHLRPDDLVPLPPAGQGTYDRR